MAATTRGQLFALLALATGAFMVSFYIRRALRSRRRRIDGDDDSGVDLDDITSRDADVTEAVSDDNQESAPGAAQWNNTKPTRCPPGPENRAPSVNVPSLTSLPEFTDESYESTKPISPSEEGIHIVDQSDGLLEYKPTVVSSGSASGSALILNPSMSVDHPGSVPVEASIDFLSVPRAPPPTRNVSQNNLDENNAPSTKNNTLEDLVRQGKGGLSPIPGSPRDRSVGKMREHCEEKDEPTEPIDQLDVTEKIENNEDYVQKKVHDSLTEKMGCLAASNYNTMAYECLQDKSEPLALQESIEVHLATIEVNGSKELNNQHSEGYVGTENSASTDNMTDVDLKGKETCSVKGTSLVEIQPNLKQVLEDTVDYTSQEASKIDEGEPPKAPPPSRCMSREFKDQLKAAHIPTDELQRKLEVFQEKDETAGDSTENEVEVQKASEDHIIDVEQYTCNYGQFADQTDAIDVDKYDEVDGNYEIDGRDERDGRDETEGTRAPPPSRCMSREFSKQEQNMANMSDELSQKLTLCQEESVNSDTEMYICKSESLIDQSPIEIMVKENVEDVNGNLNSEQEIASAEVESTYINPSQNRLTSEVASHSEDESQISTEEIDKNDEPFSPEQDSAETNLTFSHKPIQEPEAARSSDDKDNISYGQDRSGHLQSSLGFLDQYSFRTPESVETTESDDVMVDSREASALSDICDADGQIVAGPLEDMLSEMDIFGKLPPPYGYEEASTSFGVETEGGKGGAASLAFSPPTGFKDWDHTGLLVTGGLGTGGDTNSDDDIEVIHVRSNSCTTPLTYSIVNNYDSRLYTHYEENEDDSDNDGDNSKQSSTSGSGIGRTDSEIMDSLVFDLEEILPESEDLKMLALEESGLSEEALVDLAHFGSELSQSEEVQKAQLEEMGVYVTGADIVVLDEDITEGEEEEGSEAWNLSLQSSISNIDGQSEGIDISEDIASPIYNLDSDSTEYSSVFLDTTIDSLKNESQSTSSPMTPKDGNKNDVSSSLSEAESPYNTQNQSQGSDGSAESSASRHGNHGLSPMYSSDERDTNGNESIIPFRGHDIEDEDPQPKDMAQSKRKDRVDRLRASGLPCKGGLRPDDLDPDSCGKEAYNEASSSESDDTVVLCQTPESFDLSLNDNLYNAPETALASPEGASAIESQSEAGDQKSSEEIESTLSHVTEDTSSMTSAEAEVLTSLLTSSDEALLQRALITIGNAAAFTKNQNLLREAGCLKRLIVLLRSHTMALRVGQSVIYPAVITRVVNTVTNLAVNEENQKQLQDCIPALIDFAKCASAPESVQVSSLQALTNLSVTSSYHPPYTKLIQHLYECLDNGSPNIQLHALKVLVNLSSNPEMVPHLLAAKAPSSLLSAIVPRTDEDILLRWVTLLANVMWTSRDKGLTSTSLPTEYKAASPETMWTALYGHNNSVHLRSKVFVLSKHKHESVRYHAARIYSCLT